MSQHTIVLCFLPSSSVVPSFIPLSSSELTLNDVSATSIPSRLSLEAILSDRFLLFSSIPVTYIPVIILPVSCLSHIVTLDLCRTLHTSTTTHNTIHTTWYKHHYRIITTTDHYSNHGFNDKSDTSGIHVG